MMQQRQTTHLLLGAKYNVHFQKYSCLPTEGQWKFQGGEGWQKHEVLKFPGGWGVQTKKPSIREVFSCSLQ